MNKIFHFGEKVKGYDIPVLNEREVRAGSGILLLFAMIGFMNAWLKGNFFPLKIFVVFFFIDFIIRIFINPKFSPSLILGRVFIRNQEVEYVGASQKKFAWIIGLILVSFMMVFLVILNLVSPINFFICGICLIFLFFESIFGICFGCQVYKLFNKKQSLCAGGVCEIKKKEKIQLISIAQIIIIILFLIAIILVPNLGILKNKAPKAMETTNYFGNNNNNNQSESPTACEVPQWAIDIGHEEIYKEHHGCV